MVVIEVVSLIEGERSWTEVVTNGGRMVTLQKWSL